MAMQQQQQSTSDRHPVLSLPLVCLETANHDLTLMNVVERSHTTVIDFWTTRCTRCPDALDDFNEVSEATAAATVANGTTETSSSTQFISICCDSLDGAREILERPAVRRWNALQHFYMPLAAKEEAKRLLGFAQVPFYAVFTNGELVYSGNKLGNSWERHQPPKESAIETGDIELTVSANPKADDISKVDNHHALQTPSKHESVERESSPGHVFMINDLDF